MMKTVPVFLVTIVGLALLSGLALAEQPSPTQTLTSVEPYKRVRSLRVMQDQLLTGGPEAINLLNRFLADVGDQMERSPEETWEKPKNIYAAITYLFNGGNPRPLSDILNRSHKDIRVQALAESALAYAAGRKVAAHNILTAVSAPEFPEDLILSAFLVTADLLGNIEPEPTLKRLDQVRLRAPGTLFEEASIRRSLPIAARLGAVDKVELLARSYIQRFMGSPFQRDFINQLKDAALALDERISNAQLLALWSSAKPGQQYSFYLRIARGALLAGQMRRGRFFSREARLLAAQLRLDPTAAEFYAAASSVATDEAANALIALSRIKPDRLPLPDQKLLRASQAIGRMVTGKPIAVKNTLNQPDEPAQTDIQDSKNQKWSEGIPETDEVRILFESAQQLFFEIDALLREENDA